MGGRRGRRKSRERQTRIISLLFREEEEEEERGGEGDGDHFLHFSLESNHRNSLAAVKLCHDEILPMLRMHLRCGYMVHGLSYDRAVVYKCEVVSFLFFFFKGGKGTAKSRFFMLLAGTKTTFISVKLGCILW